VKRNRRRELTAATPVAASLALLLSACGGGDSDSPQADNASVAAVQNPGDEENDASTESTAALVEAVADFLDSQAEKKAETKADKITQLKAAVQAAQEALAREQAKEEAGTADRTAGSAAAEAAAEAVIKASRNTPAAARDKERAPVKTTDGLTPSQIRAIDDAVTKQTNESIYQEKGGATDVGITKETIKLGSVGMHGMALGKVFIKPIAEGIRATMTSINDRGGILGRRMSLVDCDDGPGETSRSKACLRKLVEDEKIFGMLSYTSWASASVHDDLKRYKIPAVGTWAYSQTEWQDPYMFPTHMSMIHESIAGANWVKNVIKPKTYGLLCLTSPEMQLACDNVERVLNESGAKLVQKINVGISESTMSPYVLSMRAANPEHIVHYVINFTTIAKFILETEVQNWYPSKGISGNHLAAEVLGSVFGMWPANRYWTNTTYKLWGPEFMATMARYSRGNKGVNHHIVQSSYTGVQVFAQAAKAVGPNLTRERLMAQLANGDVYASDPALGQKFSWKDSERYGDDWDPELGNGREFMYKYASPNTVGNPNGTPSGFLPDPDQFVISTHE
jgi:ABC-type branched-subunit amino acid transport system substrate-binding protein